MPCLNGTKHTIIGRLAKGQETLNIVEGINDYKKSKSAIAQQIKNMPGTLGYGMKTQDEKKPVVFESRAFTRVLIKDCGVYKFSQNKR